MAEIQGQSFDQYLYTAQISNTLHVFRYFLISVFAICFFIHFIYTFFYNSSYYLNIWLICTETFIGLNLLLLFQYFKPEQYSLKVANYWIHFICFASGVAIALGIYLSYSHLPLLIPEFDPFEAISLVSLLIISCLLIAITFLTQRFRYFLLFFFPVITPFTLLESSYILNHYLPFFLTTNFTLVMLVICAYVSTYLQRYLSKFNFKNTQLVNDAESQVEITKQLNEQLNIEMKKSKDTSLELHNYSQTLEERIKERTFDLENIHHDLKNKQTNLVLAHEIAGLIPWDWNIRERKITLSDKSNKIHLKNSDLHRAKLLSLIHPDDLEHFKTEMRQHLRGTTERFEATYRVKGYDDKWYWVHDIGSVILRDPHSQRPLHMVGIRRDIHQERQDQERLKLTASVLQQAAEGIVILDEDFKYIEINPFFEKITGFSREQIIGKHIFDITENYKARQRSNHNKIITQIMQNGIYDGDVTEKFLSGKKTAIRLHINAVKDEQNRTINYIGIISDLTEQKLQEQRLSYLENYNKLTDLPNRLYYHEQLHQYLISQKNSIQQLAIIRLNIDRFRPVNEYLTNSGGDELLRQFSQRLRLVTAEAFIVAHLNSDNFAIVYEVSHIRPSIKEHCERITKTLHTPFSLGGQEQFITVSMGIALYPKHGRQIDYLNNCAEQALFEAKRLGGNTVKIYSNEMSKLADESNQLERELRQAIHNDELIVHYQPKLYFKNHKIQGFEVLVRWQHPTKGLIPPNIFIPIAEQTSLISEIGQIVIEKTAQQIQIWKSMGYEDIRVSFNVAAQQLHRGNLLNTIDTAINKYQISGQNLELELTESSLLENSHAMKKTLEEISKRNIQISLDDFGTGYSSLSYLTDFPIDILKIDKSFVSKIGQPKQEAIISAIVTMGQAMGMTIVAEGIETNEQLDFLNNLNCHLAQGYLFSKPLTASAATDFLKMNSA
ncbi:MAG: EAL domain-containing protein [Acinetobacter sp.]|nr:EAL domain-containing protein [Acinetobacter sp.]